MPQTSDDSLFAAGGISYERRGEGVGVEERRVHRVN